jgi:hypothetical protein
VLISNASVGTSVKDALTGLESMFVDVVGGMKIPKIGGFSRAEQTPKNHSPTLVHPSSLDSTTRSRATQRV